MLNDLSLRLISMIFLICFILFLLFGMMSPCRGFYSQVAGLDRNAWQVSAGILQNETPIPAEICH
jgi:hypothetical protein